VTGDYVVAGWVKGTQNTNGFAQGTISVPDTLQAPHLQSSVPTSVPVDADIVAAYLYWGAVESS
jgi:hypothetical protein